jgi:hypothetical protein
MPTTRAGIPSGNLINNDEDVAGSLLRLLR